MAEKRMFHEGLFGEENGKPYLIGKRCKKCGNLQFPQKGFCQKCLSDDLVDEKIGTEGKLFSYTTTYGKVSRLTGPFDVGYVQLPEGIRIFAPIHKNEDQEYRIGQEMKLEIEDIWEADDGVTETAYSYRVAE